MINNCNFIITMSKVGKKPIKIPEGVKVDIEKKDNFIEVKVEGKKGSLSKKFPSSLEIKKEEDEIIVLPNSRKKVDRLVKSLWGTVRSLISNMVEGVSQGFEKKLQIEGIGYKAKVEKDKLILSLGYSHPIEFDIEEGIEIKVEKNIISVLGADKEKVGQVASRIRSLRKPEPYKGKGIRYLDEVIRKKTAKKAVAAK